MTLNIEEYNSGDEHQIVQLLRLVFKDWPKLDINGTPLEYWKWKYLDNPYNKILIVLAKNEEQIVGCHHDVPVKININKELYDCTYTADLAVDHNYRKLGISTGMREYKEKNVKINELLSYFVTSNQKLIKSFSRQFKKLPCEIKNYFYITDLNEHFNRNSMKASFIIKALIKIFKAWNRIKKSKLKNDIEKVKVTEVRKFDSSINDFFSKINGDYDLIIHRNSEYLNWRYSDDRAGNHCVYIATGKDGSVLGYIVLIFNSYNANYPVGFITEIITLNKRTDVADILVKKAKKFFFDNGVNLINFLIPAKHPYEGLMRRHGFIYSRININLFYQQFRGPELSELLKTNNPEIFFSWGDLDTFPTQIPRSSVFSYLFKEL
jgi:hypothetical protein